MYVCHLSYTTLHVILFTPPVSHMWKKVEKKPATKGDSNINESMKHMMAVSADGMGEGPLQCP